MGNILKKELFSLFRLVFDCKVFSVTERKGGIFDSEFFSEDK